MSELANPDDRERDAPVQQVHVSLGARSYDIAIGPGALKSIGPQVHARGEWTHAVVLTDSHVQTLHAPAVVASLASQLRRVDQLQVPAGEASKSAAEAERLWRELLALPADRKTLLVAVGGGVIGDLAGFVAATFARGVAFWQVPTTLLAQVDSSVGGKVGINLPGAKNMVGAFWQPQGVTIDPQVLHTLPEREYRAGLAEVVKYGVILDAEFFAFLEQNVDAIKQRDAAVMRRVVARCCELKADVVTQDEREETGLRAVLNYGHTFAHALEAVSGYGTLLHGEAVAVGMHSAALLAASLNRVDEQFVQRQRQLLHAFDLPSDYPGLDPDALLAAMQRDKKVAHGELRFILPSRLGHVELVERVAAERVREALP